MTAFQHFMWSNLITRQEGTFSLSQLDQNIELFAWMAGHKRRVREAVRATAGAIAAAFHGVRY